MGYFLIRKACLIQFLPIPQSSIAKLCSTGVQQLAMASNLFGGSGMHGKLYTIHQILSSTVAILAQGTSWADAVTQAFFFPALLRSRTAVRKMPRAGSCFPVPPGAGGSHSWIRGPLA